MEPSKNEASWQAGFCQRLKTKSHEQFNLLLCDLGTCDKDQSFMLQAILLDDNGHLSALNWARYVTYAITHFSDRKSQLQRLVNKALELLPESANKDSIDYSMLHMYSAKLKR